MDSLDGSKKQKMTAQALFSCPYCDRNTASRSRDHIFPAFLGGRRKIQSCGGTKSCNNTFGHTYEVGASKYLLPLHVFISSWGLPLQSVSPIWVGAHYHEGNPYDLEVSETGVRPVLSSSSPHIEWDKDRQIASRQFRTRAEAERFAQQLLKKGKAKHVEIVAEPPPKIDIAGLGIELQLGPDIKRLALKMSVAAATLLPHFRSDFVSLARPYLTGAKRTGYIDAVSPAYDSFPALDNMRDSLCHLVYVSLSNGELYSVVQFFGVVQFYWRVSMHNASAPDAAILGALDPVTGHEHFSDAPLIQFPAPPFSIPAEEYVSKLSQWFTKFRTEAVTRGATHPPDLRIQEVRVEH